MATGDEAQEVLAASLSVEDITITDERIKVGAAGEVSPSTLEEGVKKKVPRRIIHFSDGIVEEYSTDEEEEPEPTPIIDTTSLTWFPWFWHYLTRSAYGLLGGADFCGEKLAWMFGITSPKYQYYIDQHNKIQAEEEAERVAEAANEERLRQRELKEVTTHQQAYDNTAAELQEDKY